MENACIAQKRKVRLELLPTAIVQDKLISYIRRNLISKEFSSRPVSLGHLSYIINSKQKGIINQFQAGTE